VATCLRLWRELPLRSPTRRLRALPLAEIEPFHSSQICRLLISFSAFNFRVEGVLARKGGKTPPPPPRRQIAHFDVQPSRNFSDPPVVRRLLKLTQSPTRKCASGIFCFPSQSARSNLKFLRSTLPLFTPACALPPGCFFARACAHASGPVRLPDGQQVKWGWCATRAASVATASTAGQRRAGPTA